jgi:ABC-2 type transport system ATP-binding protein
MDKNISPISIRDVYKSFGKNDVLRGINLEIKEGEIFGFLGPNGAGKTTTIRIILDVLRPSSGYVDLFGESNQKIKKTHSKIGYLSSEMVLDKDLTGKQYLEFINSRYKGEFMANAEVLAHILKVKLSTKIGNLSTGNKQKIGLIAALMHHPKLLILDEPTQGFDPLIQQIFVKLIKQFRNKGGTVFMSSHILSEVQELCDRVGFIKDGSIVGLKTIEELRSSSRKKILLSANQKVLDKIKFQHKSLPELHYMNESGSKMVFGYSGDINKLLDYLSSHKIMDITITEPELDEIFLDLYRKEEKS